MKRKPILVRQQDQFDCGAACLASISAYFGLKLPLSRIRQYANTDRKGTTILGLVEAADKLGFQTKAIRANRDTFSSLPLPAIAHIVQPGDNMQHYIVVYRITRSYVLVADPARGIYKMPLEDFLSQWTSVLVLLLPKENFQSQDLTESNVRRFLYLLRPHTSLLIQSFVAAIVYTVLGLLTALYVGTLLDTVIPDGNEKLLYVLSIGMAVVVLFRVLFGWVRSLTLMYVSQKIDANLILGYYKHILKLPQSFFDTRRIGEIIARVNDAFKIRIAISGASLVILVDSLMIVLTFTVMFFYSWKLALMSTVLFPAFLLIFLGLRRGVSRTQRSIMEKVAELQSHFTSSINGIETIKAISAEPYSNYKTESIFTKVLQLFARMTRQQMINSTASELISSLSIIALFCVGGTLVMHNEMSLGELIAFYTLLGYITAPLSRLVGIQQTIQDALIAANRLFEILVIETEDTDNELKVILDHSKIQGHLHFMDCTFRYGARATVLNNISFHIVPGKVTAIVGESGSGKSTIIRLIQKLYSVTMGKILLDGIDLRDIDISSLRGILGVVPQDIELFHGTVMENITYGDQQPDVRKVLDICQLIGADRFINNLPQRYNTLLGEHGTTISGGQRQCLAIARALYKNPKIILLDEATSNLDSETESIIQNVIQLLAYRNITVVLIAHRLSTVMYADNIIVMEKGSILEQGSHSELLAHQGKYYDLWKRQVPQILLQQLTQ